MPELTIAFLSCRFMRAGRFLSISGFIAFSPAIPSFSRRRAANTDMKQKQGRIL